MANKEENKCYDPKRNNGRCISYNRMAEDYERDLLRLKKINNLCKEYRHNKPRLLCDLDRFVSQVEELSTTHPTESEGK